MHKTEVKGHDTKRSKDQSLMLVYSHRYASFSLQAISAALECLHVIIFGSME